MKRILGFPILIALIFALLLPLMAPPQSIAQLQIPVWNEESLPQPAMPAQGERILSYRSVIAVQADSSLLVTETIKVRSEGNRINHGIYRDFPTRFRTKKGDDYNVNFLVKEAYRDNRPENVFVDHDAYSRGERVYLGDKNTTLQPGVYTYALTYEVNRIISYQKDYDELYWNVTGNEWQFPIDQVEAVVNLPIGATNNLKFLDVWTGPERSTETGYSRTGVDSGGRLHIEVTRPLTESEGMTFAVGFPKGLVKQPNGVQEFWWHFVDNLDTMFTIFLALALLAYYVIVWTNYGRDPKPGTIFPQYEPPDGLSPAEVRYIMQQGLDSTTFTVAILNMAAKGAVQIRQEKGFLGLNKKYFIVPTEGTSKASLSPEEQALYNALLSDGEIEMCQANSLTIQAADSALKDSIDDRHKNKYFLKNTLWAILPFVISFVLFLVMGGTARHHLSNMWGGVMLMVTMIGLFALNMIFCYLVKAATPLGRKTMDQIEGFKMFLSVTEKDAMEFRNPPEVTPEIFEKYLPYALALDVENKWAKRFDAAMKRAGEDATHYSPVWYSGSDGFSVTDFTSDVTDGLSSAISDSGFSSDGGGSSGGGGGGGGGGGW